MKAMDKKKMNAMIRQRCAPVALACNQTVHTIKKGGAIGRRPKKATTTMDGRAVMYFHNSWYGDIVESINPKKGILTVDRIVQMTGLPVHFFLLPECRTRIGTPAR